MPTSVEEEEITENNSDLCLRRRVKYTALVNVLKFLFLISCERFIIKKKFLSQIQFLSNRFAQSFLSKELTTSQSLCFQQHTSLRRCFPTMELLMFLMNIY